ncbi:MAG: cytidylate kinase-like family protein [Pirellulales bacterium]
MRSVSGIGRSRAMADVAERQMRHWALDLQTKDRLQDEPVREEVPQLIHPYVAIAREAGTDATGIAAAIAAKCGWKVMDRELLDYLAEQENLSRVALEFVDERTVSWFHEMFGKWLEDKLVSQAEYVSRLGKLVLLAAQHESLVFVGRGVQFMLPRERGLAVRLIAPLKYRIRSLMQQNECDEREAKRLAAELDSNRAQFVHRYFHHDNADPHVYDLVINLERVPRDEAVEMIANAAKKHADRLSTAASGRASAERQFHRLDMPHFAK